MLGSKDRAKTGKHSLEGWPRGVRVRYDFDSPGNDTSGEMLDLELSTVPRPDSNSQRTQ